MITIKTGTLDRQKGFEGLPEYDAAVLSVSSQGLAFAHVLVDEVTPDNLKKYDLIRYYKNGDIVAVTKTETWYNITGYTMIIFESPSFTEVDMTRVIGFLDEVLDYLY